MNVGVAVIQDAVPAFWGNVDGLPLLHRNGFFFHFKCSGALQDIKYLLCAFVVVQLLGRAGGHQFLDHAQAVGAEQVPAVALASPGIMGGVLG